MLHNAERAAERVVMTEAGNVLRAAGASIIIPNTNTNKLPDYMVRVAIDKALDIVDAIVAIGGDGSILKAAALASKKKLPILGINMGRLGFLSELEPNEISELTRLVEGGYTIEKRMMLEAKVIRRGDELYSNHGLNDAVLTRGPGCKVMEVDIYSDHQFIAKFRSDGVIISTPTGSTAYSLSAGGPIIDPTENNLTITPICAHGLYAKSFVLAPTRQVTVSIRSMRSRYSYLSVDGKDDFEVHDDDLVVVKQSEYVTDMIKIKGRSVYDIVRDKMNYGI